MQRFDALVIGGGLAGCATAFYLAREGASVALVERGRLNQGASGQNAGSLHFQLEHRLIEHADTLGEELSFYVALARLAIRDWQSLEHELEDEIELAMHGGLMLAESPEQLRRLEKKAEIESGQGLEVYLLDRDETHAKAPYLDSRVSGALYCPTEGHCNPRLVTHAFAREAQRRGARLFTDTPVTSLQRIAGGGWRTGVLDSAGGEAVLESDVVVNTAGAWSAGIARLANLHLPVFPVGLIISVTEKTAPVLRHLIQHVGRKLSMKQVEDGNILIGGGWSARLHQQNGLWDADLRATLDMASLRGNLETAASVVPGIRDLHVLRSWTGTTGITPDQLPIIGEVSKAPGFFVATGGSGFTYGPSYARLLAELILHGGTEFPLDPYSPDRFSHMNMFMG